MPSSQSPSSSGAYICVTLSCNWHITCLDKDRLVWICCAELVAAMLCRKVPCCAMLLRMVRRVPTQAPVWSVTWSSSNEQQLLLGLDKGRLALVDLRMTGSRALLFMSGTPASSGGSKPVGSSVPWTAAAAPADGAAGAGAAPVQPWHSLLALPQGWQQQHAAGVAEECVAPEALLASTGEAHCPVLTCFASVLFHH